MEWDDVDVLNSIQVGLNPYFIKNKRSGNLELKNNDFQTFTEYIQDQFNLNKKSYDTEYLGDFGTVELNLVDVAQVFTPEAV